ncbi:DUF3397 domain-containing protein [Tetragenococcus halophilus]|uniref:DUF3397 domain-containing protein n=2 Tax=Tetragenococcus halophilus TaxID=51669 RepID=A0AAN1SG06_TETHN|nr:DUF3397 domain-containing protein [Tetragenococcus halophilus]AOF49406.1 lipoprotein [Tetragenococcus halophilus]MCF1601365.1 DUF3397 domain-containing protein [Tetragenococcus halophilus]MCF1674716.1 DUF3397 domain-containing protein [Tetragenococcus halophilus]MCO7025978.1 DUF3397 domain-containing protein [Tetragenococcus halophilus]MCO8287994.1 DUF3397 domain-containing protein [Tetragenococcus halophilus]
MSTFSPIYLFWYIFPVIVLFASKLCISVFSLNKRFRLKATDIAVPFLLFGIHQLSTLSSQFSIFPYFLITLLLLGIALAIFQAYFFEEIVYRRFFKMYWRSVFLFALVLYIILIIFSIVQFF